MLEKEPAQRYQSAAEVRAALTSIGVDTSPAVPVPGPPPVPSTGLSTRFGIGAGALFLLAWLLTGALANFGIVGLSIATAVMALLVFLVSRRALHHLPELQVEYRQHGPAMGAFSFALAGFLFLLGMTVLVAAHYKWWDHSVQNQVVLLPGNRKANELLLLLSSFQGNLPQVELQTRSKSVSGDRQLALVLALSGALLIPCSLLALLETRRYRNSWTNHWQPVLVLSLAILVSIPVAHVLSGTTWQRLHRTLGAWTVSQDHRLAKVANRQRRCTITLDEVMQDLERWAQQNDYTLQRHGLWEFETPDGRIVAQLAIFDMYSRSVFDRWEVAWGGPQRRTPILKVQCLSRIDPVESLLTIDPGMVTEGSMEADQWRQILDSLEAALPGQDEERPDS
jgi:hypothetical protein